MVAASVLPGRRGKAGGCAADGTRREVRGGEMTERDDVPLGADVDPALEDAPPMAVAAVEEEPEPGPSRMGCRTELRGWAGAHLHGAVRPRRRGVGPGRPPRPPGRPPPPAGG